MSENYGTGVMIFFLNNEAMRIIVDAQQRQQKKRAKMKNFFPLSVTINTFMITVIIDTSLARLFI